MLRLEKFVKKYGGRQVLDIPSHSFSHGLTYLRGKNGSGKSSLFRCIAGISPFEGSIWLNHFHPVKTPVEYRKMVNHSPAEPVFPAFLSGKEILRFVAKARGAPKHQLDELVSCFHLSLYFEQPAQTYSSGMGKKIALAIAFLGNPALILLDEPFITLDPESCASLRGLISGLRTAGTSFLLTSHTDLLSEGIQPDESCELFGGNLVTLA